MVSDLLGIDPIVPLIQGLNPTLIWIWSLTMALAMAMAMAMAS